MSRMPIKKLALGVLITAIIILYFIGGGEKYLSIRLYQDLYAQSPIATATVFFIVFLTCTSCSLPATGALAVTSGIIFGAASGFSISLLASTLGGTLAFYSSRYLFQDLIKRRFSSHVDLVNRGIEKEGALYLFGLRMVPVIPFWLLNLLVGLTSMRVPVFILATLFGMMPVLFILSYAGSQLGSIESFSVAAIFTPGLILALSLMAVFPFLAKAIVVLVRRYSSQIS